MKIVAFILISFSGVAFSNPWTEAAKYIFKRMPSHADAERQAIGSAVVETLLADYLLQFGNDETAKEVVRDIGIAPGLLLNVFEGGPIGSTVYRYDSSHLIAHGSKIATKLAFAFGVPYLTGIDPSASAKVGVLIGNMVGRFFINQGRYYQVFPDAEYGVMNGIGSAILETYLSGKVIASINDQVHNKLGLMNFLKNSTANTFFPEINISKTWSQHLNNETSTIDSLAIGTKLCLSSTIARYLNARLMVMIGASVTDFIGQWTLSSKMLLSALVFFYNNYETALFVAQDLNEQGERSS